MVVHKGTGPHRQARTVTHQGRRAELCVVQIPDLGICVV